MNYIEILPLLSQLQIGCLLISRDRYILEANETAEQMLHGTLWGRLLDETAPGLDELQKPGQYYNVAVMEYLVLVHSPEGVALPGGTRLLCFREAKNEVTNHMLETYVQPSANHQCPPVLPDLSGKADEFRTGLKVNHMVVPSFSGGTVL